jgi:mono/diheme cytochrome c family protein/peroxiredoxin
VFACSIVCDARLSQAQHHSPRKPLEGVDLAGKEHRLGEKSETKAVVVLFLSTQCPISNGYLPELNELASTYRRRGADFYGVISDPSVTRANALKHRDEYHIQFPVLFDGSGELRLALSPTHTPQAFVLNQFDRMIYSGAINDRHVKLGQKKDAAARSFLEDAIKAAIDGRPPAIGKTRPVGCLLEDPPDKTKTADVTFTRDIAPIIQSNCASCHRPNQSAPFPLLTYSDVSSHAKQILEVTHSRFMPPWKPEPGFTRFRGEQRLSDHELSLLDAWVRSGKSEGNPADLPAPLEYTTGWPLGEPDLILQMQEIFPVPASGPDIRQYFVIPAHMTENRLISAIDFRPGKPQAVHHASFYLDTVRAGRQLDDADSAPGYGGFGGPQFEPQGTLSSWFPGMTPRPLPSGMGRLIPRGSDIVAEIHYVCTGKVERDRSKIGLYYARRSARQLVVEIQVGNKQLDIPGGEKRHLEQATYTLPVATTLLDVVPHMHVLGREMKVWASSPEGRTRPLIWIKDWDFNWQGQYSFDTPIRLPKGTRIHVDAWFDNSAENPLNPNSPPKTVGWGDSSTDEMLICTFQCTCETLSEIKELGKDQRRYIDKASGP